MKLSCEVHGFIVEVDPAHYSFPEEFRCNETVRREEKEDVCGNILVSE